MKLKLNFKILITFFMVLFLSILINCNTVQAETTKRITFKDINLYKAITNELKNSIESKDDNTQSILIKEEKIKNTSTMFLYNYNIKDLSGIENFTYLKVLYITGNNISNLENLKELKNLESLYLVNNNITNLPPLENLPNLTSLSLDNNKISNISAITNLTSLTTLNLSQNQISDLQPLANLKKLEKLNLGYNKIQDIRVLSNLTQLRDIYLEGNDIKDASVLSNLKNLITVNLQKNSNLNLESLEKIEANNIRYYKDIEIEVKAKKGRGERIEIEMPTLLKKGLDPNSKLYSKDIEIIKNDDDTTIDEKNKKIIINIPNDSYIENIKYMTYSINIYGNNVPINNTYIRIKIIFPTVGVTYRTHIQKQGWQNFVKDEAISGSEGKGLRLEGIEIKLDPQDVNGDIEYSAHVQNEGWQSWRKNGQTAGTLKKGLRLEAIKIKLTGEVAKNYDVYYRVHAQNFGWLGWAKNGEEAGTSGYGYRLEAIQIAICKKSNPPIILNNKEAFKEKGAKPSVVYSTHIQKIGWQKEVKNKETSGTSGKGLRLEAIKINLKNNIGGSIEYRTHVQNIGWQNWKSNGTMAGTSGKGLRLEAIQIRLTGEMAQKYDIYYRAHAQKFGWMGWAKNGQTAGTLKYGYRLEAIQIALVEKGGKAPGSTANTYKTK